MPSSGKGKGGNNKIADKVSERPLGHDFHVPKICPPTMRSRRICTRFYVADFCAVRPDPTEGPSGRTGRMPWLRTTEEHHQPYHAFVYD